jgi:hypothetical protein
MRYLRLLVGLVRGPRSENHGLLEAEFDDLWYRRQYAEVGKTGTRQQAFAHYLRHGARRMYSPNGAFNELWYLREYPDVRAEVEGGAFLSGFEHYLRHGRAEGRTPRPARAEINPAYVFDVLESEFDPEWYSKTYPEAAAHCAAHGITPFQHYLRLGARQRHSPNARFDELWYSAYHADVAQALKDGVYRCGFEHFLFKGRFEGLFPYSTPADYLEWKYPGVTKPVGIPNLQTLENKLTPPSCEAEADGARRMNFLLPTLDSEISFGGYAAVLQWIRKFRASGCALRILICDDAKFNEELARFQLGQHAGLADIAQSIEIRNISLKQERLPVRAADRFFAYSAWTALWAAHFARHTDEKNFLFLVQEYEAVFHPNDSFRAVVESAYRLPHVPVFNSRALADYFRAKRLGVFARQDAGAEPAWFSFEHALLPVSKPTLDQMAERKTRRLLFYARPEAHAARNLFEIGVLALRKALRQGVFDSRWTFHGIGALSENTVVELLRGVPLTLLPKTSAQAYARMLGDHDVGMSLMMAPHPSLLPYEMAAAGLVVVTNRYDYRDAAWFAAISGNIVSAEAEVDALVEALREAVRRADDPAARTAGAKGNWIHSWEAAINDELFAAVCRQIWRSAPKPTAAELLARPMTITPEAGK